MSNDSSTGGYLSPAVSTPPLEDDALDDFLQAIIVGITGIAGNLVRPRWQPEPPNLPAVGTNWIAFGIVTRTPDTFAVELHSGAGNGTDILQRHEVMDILVSAYGPNANQTIGQLKDGLQIAQNREVLFLNSMALVETTNPTAAPSLVKEIWLRRVDMTVRIRREILRTYPVLNLLTADLTLNTDAVTETINVTQ